MLSLLKIVNTIVDVLGRSARPAALVFAILGTLLCGEWHLLIFAWMVVFWFTWSEDIAGTYATFLTRLWLPLAVALIVVWAGIVGAGPDQPVGSNRASGFEYATVVALRLAVISGLVQLALLGIPAARMPEVLRFHGLSRSLVVAAVAARTLFAELRLRLDQVWTARLARGIVPTPTLLQRLRHFPHMLKPLVAWTLHSAIQRGDLWTGRQLLSYIDSDPVALQYSKGWTAWYLLLAFAWLITVVVSELS